MRKNITNLRAWTGILALLLLSFSSFAQGTNVIIQSIKSTNESACGQGDGTLKIYYHDTSPTASTYRLDCKFSDGRRFSFDGLPAGNPIVVGNVLPSTYTHFELVRETDGVRSALFDVSRRVANACDVNSANQSKNMVDVENCYGNTVSIDMDKVKRNSYINTSPSGATCIAYVDGDGNIGPSIQTFCIDPEKPAPGDYELGTLEWTRVVGIQNTGNDITELQAERVNWVFCHESDYGVSHSELYNAEQYVMDSEWADWSQLAQDAIDAIPTPQGGIADKMVFFIPSITNVQFQVQQQVVGECQPLCDNVTDAGEIGYDQTICAGDTPDEIISVSLPSGGTGDLEYVWLSNTAGPTTSGADAIEHNAPTYTPGNLTQDTWFRRCSKRQYCSDYDGESNWIKITVKQNVTDPGQIGYDQTICTGETPDLLENISLPSGGNGSIEYVWLKNLTGPTTATGVEVIASNSETFQPGSISQDTWFRRCSRTVGCSAYDGESNWVKISPVDCTPTNNEWSFNCDDGKDVEVIGKGIKGKSSNLINFANPSEIYKVVVEVIYKSSNPGTSIDFVDNNGNSYTAYRQSFSGASDVWVYRTQLPAVSSVSYSAGFSDKWNAQSMTAYAFRNVGTSVQSSGNYTEKRGYNDIQTFSINIPTATTSRDVTLEIPMSELTTDGRYLKISADAGAQHGELIEPITSLPDGCCFKMFTVNIPSVDGSVSNVDVTIDSRNNQNGLGVNGQSWVAAGFIKTTVECRSCEVLASPGMISGSSEVCSGQDAGVISSTQPAVGGTNPIEYRWLKKEGGAFCPSDASWTVIANSNTVDYSPGVLTQTTSFVRQARSMGCDNWNDESNCVVIDAIGCSNSIHCDNDISVTLTPGSTGQIVSWTEPTGSSNCPSGGFAINQTSGPSNGSELSSGTYTVTYEATDNCSMSSTCSTVVTVYPAPTGDITLDCSALSNIDVTLDPGTTTIPVSWTEPTASTTCPLGNVVVNQTAGPTSGDALAEGSYTVSYEATDDCLGTANCGFEIIVHPAPTGKISLDCSTLPDINVDLTPGESTVSVSWNELTGSTTCPLGELLVNQTSGPANGSALEVGTYTVVYEANDACLSSETCSFDITVNPAPTGVIGLECNSDIDVTIVPGMSGQVVTWDTPNPTTTCPLGNLSITQVAGPSSGDNLSAGTYTVTYEVVDGCLDTATCEFTIVVNPPPTSNISFACNSNVEITLEPGTTGQVVSWTDPSATSNCILGGVAVMQIQGPSSGSELMPGTYNIVYQAFDACLSTAMCSFEIVVNPAPVGKIELNCNNDIVTYVTPGTNSQVVVWDAPTASTTCPQGGLTITQTHGPLSGSTLEVGTYEVVYNVSDACGNNKTCSFNIVVDDVVPCAIRDILPATDCDQNETFNFYLKGLVNGISGLSDYYAYESGNFTEYENGTAALDMIVANITKPDVKMRINLVFTGRTESTTPAPIPPVCFSTNFEGWYFYENVSGTIKGLGALSGANMYATWKMNKTQLGIGANLYTDEFGMTSWLDLTVTHQPSNPAIQLSTQNYESDVYLALNGTPSDCSNTSEVVLECPTALRVAAIPGSVEAVLAWPNPTATTTCANPAVTIEQVSGPTSGEIMSINSFSMVKYRATDMCGNEAFCTFSIAVTSIPSPVCASHAASNVNDNCGTGQKLFMRVQQPNGQIDDFVLDEGTLTEKVNNTALLHAMVHNVDDANLKFMVDVNLGDKVVDLPSGLQLNGPCFTLDDGSLVYYKSVAGYMIGEGKLAGAKLKVESTTKPAILGVGGNMVGENDFGAFVPVKLTSLIQPDDASYTLPDSGIAGMNMKLEGSLGDCSGGKPVFDLDVTNDFGNAKLSWTNNTGLTNAYFSVERSSDGVHFIELSREKSNHTAQPTNYEYLDANPLDGVNYYRVTAVQNSGLGLKSNIKTLTFATASKEMINVGPVPTDDFVRVDLSSLDGQKGTVALVNSTGMVVWSSAEMEFTSIPLELSLAKHTDGVYKLLVTVTNRYTAKVLTKTIILDKM